MNVNAKNAGNKEVNDNQQKAAQGAVVKEQHGNSKCRIIVRTGKGSCTICD